LAGTIPLAEPEHDTPWPVAALVSEALRAGVPGELLPCDPLAGEPLAELPGGELLADGWLSAILLAAVPAPVVFACRAW
jgi:hypothetical protein